MVAVGELLNGLREEIQTLPPEVIDGIRDDVQETPDRTERIGASRLLLNLLTVPANIEAEPLTRSEADELAAAELAQFRTAEDDAVAGELFYALFDAIAANDITDATKAREQLTAMGYLKEIGADNALIVAEVTEIDS